MRRVKIRLPGSLFNAVAVFSHARSLTMRLREKSQIPFENRILRALPREEYVLLSPSSELVRLPAGRTLYEPGDTVRYAYFPTGGMVSLPSVTEGGATVEVGAVGREGVA